MSDQPIMTFDQAVTFLPDGDHIHTFMDGVALIGASWKRHEMLAAMLAAPAILVTGNMAQSAKHGLAIKHPSSDALLFIETTRRTDEESSIGGKYLQPLREAVNVPDAMERDRIVRRFRNARAKVVLLKNDVERWNLDHPDEVPLDTVVEDAVIAYLDGKGPFPETVMVDGRPHAFVDGKLREIPQEGAA